MVFLKYVGIGTDRYTVQVYNLRIDKMIYHAIISLDCVVCVYLPLFRCEFNIIIYNIRFCDGIQHNKFNSETNKLRTIKLQ